MKQTLRNLVVIFSLFIFPELGKSQCPNDNVLVAGNLTPPGVTLSTTQNYQFGQYVLANVVAGANYTVSTCSNSSFDTQLTVYNDATGAFLAYNDDFCGLRSQTSFTPNFCGEVRVLVDLFFCSTSTSSVDVTMTMNTAGSGIPSLTSAPDLQACTNNTVTLGIANNGSGGTTPYAYDWQPPTNLASSTVPQTTATVTATQDYTLTLTDANGCKATDTVLVTLLPAPTVNLGNDTTLCGGPILLDAQNPGATYLWSTGAGTQTLNVTLSGNYSVAVQDLNGCMNSDNIIITINPNPVVSLGNDTSTCNANLTLDAGAGFSNYSWTTGSSVQTTNVTSTGNVAVLVTDGNGCQASDTVNVTMNPAPTVNLGADTTQCGGTVTLNAGNPGALYFWSNSTSSQTTSVSSTGTYSVDVITAAGCSNSDTINVTINNQPNANLGPDTAICTAAIVLDAGNPGATYLWNNAATSQTISAGTGTWSVQITDPSGCSAQDTVVVTANVPPSVSAGPDQDICPSQSATLTGSGGLTYVWSTGAPTQSISVSPSTTTTYYVTGTDINGCSASDVVLVNVLPGSNAQFIFNVTGATANFTNQSTNAVSYSWNFGDASGTNTSANPSHTYNVNGTYTVTLTVTGPCGTDTYTQVVTITQVGLQDVDLANSLSIYPNPNDGQFTVSFEFSKAKNVTIEVVDVAGRNIFTDEESNITSFKKEIGLTAADNGMYLVRILTNDGVVTEKVMVQR
ncbi:MAG: T9SS type A sorting domain-containing protein [Bacteroidetes bacterium]|nr:T9SS type A sorting domain-containing protein [Bacteroidota bacterium]